MNTKCYALVGVAVCITLAGCEALDAWLEEPPEANVPVASASCGELARRSRELEREIDYEIARQRRHDEQMAAIRAVNPRLPPAPLSPPPRSMATEHATIAALAAEMAQRC